MHLVRKYFRADGGVSITAHITKEDLDKSAPEPVLMLHTRDGYKILAALCHFADAETRVHDDERRG